MTTPNEIVFRKVESKSNKRRFLQFLAYPLAFTLIGIYSPASFGALESDDVGMYGSVLISRKAHAAAMALKQGQFGEAQMHYKALIGMDPDEDDFYFGLYEAGRKMQQWPEVALALEELFKHKPKYKEMMPLEYGECLYHLNRYSDAEPVLKQALAKVSEPSIMDKQLKKLMLKGIMKQEKKKGKIVLPKYKEIAPVPVHEKVSVKQSHPQLSDVDLNLKAAFLKSESITIAEYKGYEKDGLISFYKPPKANFRIIEYLKGPPLNKAMPIRFEFHDKTNKPKPKDWKFEEDKIMPEKGSKWIIFIPNAVPVDGMFETYHGSYGRLKYDDDNIDQVLKILEQHKGQTR